MSHLDYYNHTMGEIEPAFIQAPEHRANLSETQAEGIPLIDLSPLSSTHYEEIDDYGLSVSDSTARQIPELVQEIAAACKEWGFFQVINHGVPPDRLQKVESTARKFFAQSLDEKKKISRDEVTIMGYYDKEHTKNVRDWKEVFDYGAMDPTLVAASPDPDDKQVAYWKNQWPQNPPEFKEACQEYAKDMVKLALKLMQLIALSLGLPAKRFEEFFVDHTSNVRLNYYPACPFPDLALGVGRHRDIGVLTVLAQDDVGGLQVKRRKDEEWVGVKPVPNAYIVNIGDTVQVWTNEIYKSAEHRVVVNSQKERLSIPFFLTPSHYTVVKPLEELINEQNPPRYRPYSWGKFQVTRKRSNFVKLNVDNIQISDFRIPETEL